MKRLIRWVAYALFVLLIVNALAYPFSFLIPKGGTLAQNFTMVLIIELIIMILFSDVVYIKHTQRLNNAHAPMAGGLRHSLIGTIVEYDYPLFITDLFLVVQIAVFHAIAF